MALRSDLGLEGDYSVPPPPRRAHMTDGVIDSNLVVILAALLCVMICALGLNSIFRCALRWSRRMVFESADDAAVRLANTGLSIKAIKALPVVVYSSANTVPPLPAEASTACPICLSEFANGEELRVFPKCNHGFHLGCIDTWLSSHSSCPTCRRNLAHVYKSDCTAVRIVVEQPGTASSGSMPV